MAIIAPPNDVIKGKALRTALRQNHDVVERILKELTSSGCKITKWWTSDIDSLIVPVHEPDFLLRGSPVLFLSPLYMLPSTFILRS